MVRDGEESLAGAKDKGVGSLRDKERGGAGGGLVGGGVGDRSWEPSTDDSPDSCSVYVQETGKNRCGGGGGGGGGEHC